MIESILKKQNEFFRTGKTKSIDFRLKQLDNLRNVIKKYEVEILDALYTDLRKPHFEGYTNEVGFSLDSIKYTMKHLKKWSKSRKVKTPFHQVGAKCFTMWEPYGTVLIIGPFNYPFQLVIEPLIGAISAGNTVIIKPSEHTSATESIIKKIISEAFDESYIGVVTGAKEETTELINSKFDHIFFTGSIGVGKVVMEAASKNLIPVTLELGGKSPTIVDETANIDIAAKRIVWGKFINAGQTCIAPDYIYVDKKVETKFKESLVKYIKDFYGEKIISSDDYGRIVNEKGFDRLVSLIDKDKIYFGGEHDKTEKYIMPTILDNVTWKDTIMEDEIFGPILPILSYDNIEDVIDNILKRPKPLALYLFSEDKKMQDRILNEISFGGGGINDTISHVATPHMPFGGVGHSGMGNYHGIYSFEGFSHRKSIIKKTTKLDFKVVFPPYNNKIKLVKKLMK